MFIFFNLFIISLFILYISVLKTVFTSSSSTLNQYTGFTLIFLFLYLQFPSPTVRHLAFLVLNISSYLINPLLCNQSFICPLYTTWAPVPHTGLTYHMDALFTHLKPCHFIPPCPLLSGHPSHPTGAPTPYQHLPPTPSVDVFLTLLRLYCLSLSSTPVRKRHPSHFVWPWHPTRGHAPTQSLASTHSAFNSSLRQLNHINALLTLLRPSYLVPGLALCGYPSPATQTLASSSGPPQLTNPLGPKCTCIHTLLTELHLMDFAQVVQEEERKGKKRRKRGHSWLWWMRLLLSSPTSDQGPGSTPTGWIRKHLVVIPQIPWISFLCVCVCVCVCVFSWERERDIERMRGTEPGRDFYCFFPMDLVKRNVSLLIISRELISLQRKP